jgi:hypothetical protein
MYSSLAVFQLPNVGGNDRPVLVAAVFLFFFLSFVFLFDLACRHVWFITHWQQQQQDG